MREKGKRIIIVGGGISGMVTAYYLLKNCSDFDIRLFERNSTLGGLIATKDSEFGVAETAANGFLNSVEVEEIFADLNISVSAKTKTYKKRYIFRKSLRIFPFNFSEYPKILGFLFKFIFLRNSVKPNDFENISHWGNRIFGTKLTKEVLEVGLQGLYGGNSAKLQACLVIPPFSWFNEKPTPSKTIKGTVAPLKGMGFFIDQLENWLLKNGCLIEKNHEVTAFQIQEFRKCGDKVILAQKIAEAAGLLKMISDSRGEALERVNMKGLISCTCFYEADPNDLRGFGVLFQEQNNLQPLGILFNNDIFPDRENRYRSETAIFSDKALALTDEQILTCIGEAREKIGQKNIKPVNYVLARWSQALPEYGIELQKALLDLQIESNGIYLIGNYLGQIGLTKILLAAKRLAATLTAQKKVIHE